MITERNVQLVNAVATGRYPSIAAAAKAIGMKRQSAYRMLSDVTVSNALARAKRRQLDKARSGADRAARLAEELLAKLDPDQITDPTTVIEAARRLKDYQRKDLEIVERFGRATCDEETLIWHRWRLRSAVARSLRWAVTHPERVGRIIERCEKQTEDYHRRLMRLQGGN